MNYTEKYHLPQWKKEDRVMMEDFNSAMSNLDTVLSREQAGLFRMAYNHYCAVSEMDPFPHQLGVFHQDPAVDSSGVAGTIKVDGTAFTGKNSAQVTVYNLGDYMEQLSPLKVVRDNLAACAPMVLRLRLPAPIHLWQFPLRGNYSNGSGQPDTYRLRLVEEESGQTVAETTAELGLKGGSGSSLCTPLHMNFFLHPGTDYLLRVEPLAATYDTTMELNLTPTLTSLSCHIGDGTVTASRTLTGGGSCGGMLILCCQTGGAGGTLEVTWDGAAMEPSAVRTRLDQRGWSYQELIYLRERDIPAETTVSMKFSCNKEGDFFFYDWGAILL